MIKFMVKFLDLKLKNFDSCGPPPFHSNCRMMMIMFSYVAGPHFCTTQSVRVRVKSLLTWARLFLNAVSCHNYTFKKKMWGRRAKDQTNQQILFAARLSASFSIVAMTAVDDGPISTMLVSRHFS
jgi:hypothetical protein